MKIKSLVLKNYKQFSEQTKLELWPEVNLLQGNGQTGKTTVLHVVNCLMSMYPPKDYYACGVMNESYIWSSERAYNRPKDGSLISAMLEVTQGDLANAANINKHIGKVSKGKPGLIKLNFKPGDVVSYKIINGKEVVEPSGEGFIRYLKYYNQLMKANARLKPLVRCFPEGKAFDLKKCKDSEVVLIDNPFGKLSSSAQIDLMAELLHYQEKNKTQFIITIRSSEVISNETIGDANWLFLKDRFRQMFHLS